MCQIHNTAIEKRDNFIAYKVVRRIPYYCDSDRKIMYKEDAFFAPFRDEYIYHIHFFQEVGGDSYTEGIIRRNKTLSDNKKMYDALNSGYLHFFPSLEVAKKFILENIDETKDYTVLKVLIKLDKPYQQAFMGQFRFTREKVYPSVSATSCEVLEEIKDWML